MGEYWIPTNVTKKQFVNPHKMDNGLKLSEWQWPESATMKRINQLIKEGHWSKRDDIRAFSDYGQELQIFGSPTDGVKNDPDGDMYSPEDYVDVSNCSYKETMSEFKQQTCEKCEVVFISARDHRYCMDCNTNPEFLAERVAALETLMGGLRFKRRNK